ncbi:MAG: flagellar filament capping protein FliD [Tepidimonas sp.]|uniref:flagellar filament capping protein FliD n=1 Tax=Tepidimonas sp. TaxID=2002775 RepID=UPI00298F3490|nr:flagellar filament capping protein FliD [Tepidimonas sp.]MDW8336505.1 flagellar filament capping protein FliD [Tepidimonas sp.]
MPTLSSPGIGSGLDIKNIVSQLVEIEKRPLTSVQLRTTAAQTRLSVVGQIKSHLAALDDSLRTLTLASTYQGMKVTSTSEAVQGVAAFTAVPASYNVQVQQLAQGQVARSTGMTGPVGQGTLTLQLGQWQGGTFTPGTGAAVSISVAASDSLADIANKINQAAAGVRASVINDTSGQRLVVRSSATGVEQGFRIQVSDSDGHDTDAAGLSRLAYDPPAGTAGLVLTQAAQDTVALIDGVQVTSSTRTIADAIPGVTLQVSQVTSQPVAVEVARDADVARKAIQTFVDAYNKLNGVLNDALKVDPQTGQVGPLQGDAAVVTLQSALRRMLGVAGPGSPGMQRWSDLGVEMQRDGSLKVNDARLSAALSDPMALQTLMAEKQGSTQGLAQQFRDFTAGALAAEGRINLKARAIEQQIGQLNDQARRIQERAERTEQRLLQQYQRLDSTVARLNGLSQYVSQQIAAWNKAAGKS